MANGFLFLLADTGPGSSVLRPVIVLALCAVAGLATWLTLPGRREVTWTRIGAVILLAVGLVFGALLFRATTGDPKNAMGPFFWLFALTSLGASVRVITHARPIYSALYFVLTVFATAGLFVLLWAEFMAAALVLIYAGAILIVYIFVIMLASEAATGAVGSATEFVSEHDAYSRSPFFGAVAGFGTLALLLVMIFNHGDGLQKRVIAVSAPIVQHVDEAGVEVAATPSPVVSAEDQAKMDDAFAGSTQALGRNLIEVNPINLQLSALILTLSMVGAITLSRRKIIVSKADALKSVETVTSPNTPVDDDPHSIPVYGTTNPRQKAYPEN